MAAIPAERSSDCKGLSTTAIICASVLAGTLLLSALSVPGIPCLFQAAFHLPCPGCGLTRSLKSIWSGDVIASVRYHPLGMPLFAACLGYLATVIFRFQVSPRFRDAGFRRTAWLAVLALLVVVWAARLTDRLFEGGFFLTVLGRSL